MRNAGCAITGCPGTYGPKPCVFSRILVHTRRPLAPLLPFRPRPAPSSGAAPIPRALGRTNLPGTACGRLAAGTAPPDRADRKGRQQASPKTGPPCRGGAGRRRRNAAGRLAGGMQGRPLASLAASRWGCRHVRPPSAAGQSAGRAAGPPPGLSRAEPCLQ